MKSALWYPYQQHKTSSEPFEVDSAEGCKLHIKDGRILIDGISSWWCTIHGYNHPKLNNAITEQLSKMGHVMLGGLTHKPAKDLADKLVEITPDGLNHVFFSDSGSVGMEVAMKLALQYFHNKGHVNKKKFIALKKGYHGDTCGVISIGDPDDGMHASFAGVFPKQFFVSVTSEKIDPEKWPLEEKIEELESIIGQNHREIAAMAVEPLMQGAGGFNFYPAEYLNRAYQLCQKYNILMIFDEIATGFGRTGTLFAANQCNFTPDILVLGKALTAGYSGHAATLTTGDVYDAFYSEKCEHAFMHGPTFMGNPLACAVALEGIKLFECDDYMAKIKAINHHLSSVLLPFKHTLVKNCRVLGATGVIEFHAPLNSKKVKDFAAEKGVWLRPFGNILYTTPPYIISQEELAQVLAVMTDLLNHIT